MKKLFLIISISLIVLAVPSFLLLNGTKPDSVCAEPGTPYSGFVDPDKDNCPITDESYAKIADYNSKPKVGRILGLIMVTAGVGFGVAALVIKGGKPSANAL